MDRGSWIVGEGEGEGSVNGSVDGSVNGEGGGDGGYIFRDGYTITIYFCRCGSSSTLYSLQLGSREVIRLGRLRSASRSQHQEDKIAIRELEKCRRQQGA